MLDREETVRGKCPEAVDREVRGIFLDHDLVSLEMESVPDEARVATRVGFVTSPNLIRDECV